MLGLRLKRVLLQNIRLNYNERKQDLQHNKSSNKISLKTRITILLNRQVLNLESLSKFNRKIQILFWAMQTRLDTNNLRELILSKAWLIKSSITQGSNLIRLIKLSSTRHRRTQWTIIWIRMEWHNLLHNLKKTDSSLWIN